MVCAGFFKALRGRQPPHFGAVQAGLSRGSWLGRVQFSGKQIENCGLSWRKKRKLGHKPHCNPPDFFI
jgi:hypothetical protein